MARGKPRSKFPDEYPSEDEDTRAAREERANAPQAKPHKRGGVHKMKDEHLTDTKWDKMTRDEMLAAAREDPTYISFFAKFKAEKQKVKDLQKHVLARTLADADEKLERKAKKAKKENAKLKKNAKMKAKEAEEERQAEQQRKLEDRLRKEEEGQILSDEDADEDELIQELPQVYLQQEDSDISDTTSTHSSESPTYPPHRLRMFEWSFNDPPSNNYWETPRTWPQNEELQPRQLTYTPMNVVTMHGHEMLHTPVIDAKEEGTEPDRVPALSEEVKDCARNGVLIGPLEDAVVESGHYWSMRTIVQAWNGRIYFNLPRPDEDLADVYRQWKSRGAREKRMMNRQPLYEAGAHKRDRRLQTLRKQEQRKITKKVYRASQWRPTLVYLPAYLPSYYEGPYDAPEDKFDDRDIKSLFYVRLKGESVPSFFFWVDKDDWKNPTWKNPTEPNPKYVKYREQHSGRDSHSQLKPQRRSSKLARVKKVPYPSRFRSTRTLRLTTRYDFVLWAMERALYHFGLGYTLNVFHDKWLDEGREDAWHALTHVLRNQLPPSGKFPTHPPVRLERDPSMISIAEKMTRVEYFNPNPDKPILPIYVNDDWTRNDDAYWTTEERPRTPVHDGMDVKMQSATPISRAGRPVSRSDTTTPRPTTPDTPHSLHRRISDVFAWVSTVSTSGSQFYNSPSPAAVEQIQEGRNLALDILADKAPAFPFGHNMWIMMQDRYRLQRQVPDHCAICLEKLGEIPLLDYEQHLIDHMVHIHSLCPFCNIHWDSMDGLTKAHHVHTHYSEAYETDAWKEYATKHSQIARRNTQTPPEWQRNVAVPRRKSSVVRFAPTTVGQRTAYNDNDLAHPQGIYAPGSTFDTYPQGPNTTGSSATFSSWTTRSSSRKSSQNSQGRPEQNAAKVPTKSSMKKNNKKNKADLTIVTNANGRRQLEYVMPFREYVHRAAHDSRRKSSSDSMTGTHRAMRVYTYIDNGEGWASDKEVGSDGFSDDEDGDDGGGDERPRRRVQGGEIGAGRVVPEQVVEVGSEDEDEVEDSAHDSEKENDEDEQNGSSDDDEGEDHEDYGQDGEEADGDSSGSEDDDAFLEKEESAQPPSRKRPKRSNGESESSPKQPTVSPLTPHSSGRNSHQSISSQGSTHGPAFPPPYFPADGWVEMREERSLWEDAVEMEQQDEQATDEDYEDEGLIMDETHPLMSVKKGKRKRHIPPSQQHKPSTHRSPAPSPSSSLALAEVLRRRNNSAVPPNTPAVGDEGLSDIPEGSLSQPPSPGQLSDRIKEQMVELSYHGEDDGEEENSQEKEMVEEDLDGIAAEVIYEDEEYFDNTEVEDLSEDEDDEGVSREEIEEDVPPSRPRLTKRQQAMKDAAEKRKQAMQEATESSSDDDEEEDDEPTRPVPNKPAKKKPAPAAKKAQPRKRMTEAQRLVAEARKWNDLLKNDDDDGAGTDDGAASD
ncbi:hypothetical protein PMIN04_009262 [Paraphaeosphaeria minitans]